MTDETRKIEGINKILLVEDTAKNIEAAEKQLSMYELTIVKSFDKYMDQIKGTYLDMGSISFEHGMEVRGKISRNWEFPAVPSYDVVLTDLNIPMRPYDKEAPLGYTVALIASMAKIPYVGIVTATNHHQGPIAETFGHLRIPLPEYNSEKAVFDVNGTRVMLFDDDDFNTRDEPKRWDQALGCLVVGRGPVRGIIR